MIKLILLHTVVALHYVHHIEMVCLIKGANTANLLKTDYFESSLVSNCVQTCSFTSFYICLYIVCSYDIPQDTGRTD